MEKVTDRTIEDIYSAVAKDASNNKDKAVAYLFTDGMLFVRSGNDDTTGKLYDSKEMALDEWELTNK